MDNSGTIRFISKILILAFAVVVIVIGVMIKNGNIKIPDRVSFSSAPKPGSCLLLEERYCSGARFLYVNNLRGSKDPILGFNVPAGLPVFAPIDGEISLISADNSEDSNNPYKGVLIRRFLRPNSISGLIDVNIISNPLERINENLEIKKGDIIGYTSDNPMTDFDNYTLIVSINNQALTPGTVYSSPELYIKDKLGI